MQSMQTSQQNGHSGSKVEGSKLALDPLLSYLFGAIHNTSMQLKVSDKKGGASEIQCPFSHEARGKVVSNGQSPSCGTKPMHSFTDKPAWLHTMAENLQVIRSAFWRQPPVLNGIKKFEPRGSWGIWGVLEDFMGIEGKINPQTPQRYEGMFVLWKCDWSNLNKHSGGLITRDFLHTCLICQRHVCEICILHTVQVCLMLQTSEC